MDYAPGSGAPKLTPAQIRALQKKLKEGNERADKIKEEADVHHKKIDEPEADRILEEGLASLKNR